MSAYTPANDRYERNGSNWFRRCGKSGLLFPAVSLGMWHNFGGPGTDAMGHADEASFHENCKRICYTAFDHGITHFDLANNYGPPPGEAERRTGRILKDFPREELIISSKAGYRMWPGPYGEWGSRKNLLQSLEQSLQRLQLDHVDIFYHHRPDPDTPLEESLGALDQAVKSGKALYAAISNYPGALTSDAIRVMKENHWPRLLIHQVYYHMLARGPETDLFPHLAKNHMGAICFCPLAQGLLTNKYLQGIPKDSRAAAKAGFLRPGHVTDDKLAKVAKLNDMAQQRGQTLAQMALAWTLRHPEVTSALIGASRPEQIVENVKVVQNMAFTGEELNAIDRIVV